MKKIRLTEAEMSMLVILSSMRTLMARSNNIKNLKGSTSRNDIIELDGIIGEYAFCKMNNIFMAEIVPSVNAMGADCVYNGKNIDIKSTRHKHGRLIGHIKRNTDIDVYVLAIIDDMDVTFPGWLYADELYDSDNIMMLGGYSVYAVNQEDLRRW